MFVVQNPIDGDVIACGPNRAELEPVVGPGYVIRELGPDETLSDLAYALDCPWAEPEGE
jgi:hypothetical protein